MQRFDYDVICNQKIQTSPRLKIYIWIHSWCQYHIWQHTEIREHLQWSCISYLQTNSWTLGAPNNGAFHSFWLWYLRVYRIISYVVSYLLTSCLASCHRIISYRSMLWAWLATWGYWWWPPLVSHCTRSKHQRVACFAMLSIAYCWLISSSYTISYVISCMTKIITSTYAVSWQFRSYPSCRVCLHLWRPSGVTRDAVSKQ